MAYDDAGAADNEPHLTCGEDWRFDNPGEADEAVRTASFGERVEFRYAGLHAEASYKVKLRFFSDGPREERVTAGDIVLLNAVVLEKGKVVEREVEIPPAAYRSGKLALAFEKVAGLMRWCRRLKFFPPIPLPWRQFPCPNPSCRC